MKRAREFIDFIRLADELSGDIKYSIYENGRNNFRIDKIGHDAEYSFLYFCPWLRVELTKKSYYIYENSYDYSIYNKIGNFSSNYRLKFVTSNENELIEKLREMLK